MFNKSQWIVPVVKTLCFQCRGHGFDLWRGNKIPHATWYSQKIQTKTKQTHSLLKSQWIVGFLSITFLLHCKAINQDFANFYIVNKVQKALLKMIKLKNETYKWLSNILLKMGASLVVQWLRVCLPMQGTRVRALAWEDPTCHGATRPVSHNYWACASGACAPQQERPR